MLRRIYGRRDAFTLVELLVVMAATGLLMALLIPAVQSARESARRLTCLNHLRQCGLGLHNYHDSRGCFPPGSYVMGPSFAMQSGWGWGAMILPAVDQAALYTRIDFGRGTAVGDNLALIATPLALWRCPSETAPDRVLCQPPDRPQYPLASGNFCGSEGVLSSMSCVRISEIRDGASCTLLAGERIVQPGVDGSLPFTSAWCGQVAFDTEYDYRSVPHLQPDRFHPINAATSDTSSFGSRHTGGANFLLADGSARFFSEETDALVLEALGTRAGGEAVELP